MPVSFKAFATPGLAKNCPSAKGFVAPAACTCVEEYNGTSWATGGTMPFGSEFGQTNGGTQNALGAATVS